MGTVLNYGDTQINEDNVAGLRAGASVFIYTLFDFTLILHQTVGNFTI